MFVQKAHTFSRQASFVITLSAVAGYTNILAILSCGMVISHVSGTMSNLGKEIAEGSVSAALLSLAVVTSFFAGAWSAGLCEEIGKRLNWRSIYALPLLLETMLLAAFGMLLEFLAGQQIGISSGLAYISCIAAAAMGLQNATITKISGGVIRTTHMTGIVTDMGLEAALLFVRWWSNLNAIPMVHSRRTVETNIHGSRRFMLLAFILLSFFVGAFCGTVAHYNLPRFSFVIPFLILLVIICWELVDPIAAPRE